MTGTPTASICAVRDVPHAPAQVYAFLARLDNHWELGGRTLRVSAIDENRRGGRIIVAAPFGLRRTARTLVTAAQAPRRVAGIAEVGRNTRAQVQWTIEPSPCGARVALETTIWTPDPIDRSLLHVGGRWWLRRAFRRTLDALAGALDHHYGPCMLRRTEPLPAAIPAC